MPKIGLQLYTVRDHLEKDYMGTVAKACEMGYDGVELPGGVLEKVKAAEIKALLDEHKTELIGIVFEHRDLEERMEEVLKYCGECGCTRVIYPYIPDELRRNEEEFVKVAKQIESFGKILHANGIDFFYHIHGYEFSQYGPRTGMDILIENFNFENTRLEIDVYWVEYGGKNSVEFMKKYGKQSPLIHFKDYKDANTWYDTEVGDGLIDVREIARIGAGYNAQWFIVEQEQFEMDSMDSAAISLENLRRASGEFIL